MGGRLTRKGRRCCAVEWIVASTAGHLIDEPGSYDVRSQPENDADEDSTPPQPKKPRKRGASPEVELGGLEPPTSRVRCNDIGLREDSDGQGAGSPRFLIPDR